MKSKGHVYMANLMIELLKDSSKKIAFPDIQGNTSVPPLIRDCILKYPSYFRAGSVGPDFFPDFIFGQSVIHPKVSGKWLEIMHDELMQIPPGTEQQGQAISFYMGYMMHYAGDMFTHDYVNGYAKGWFPDISLIADDLASKKPQKIKKAVDQVLIILRHIAIEKYLDDYIEKLADKNHIYIDKTLDIPVDYLRRCFASKEAINRLSKIDKKYAVDTKYNFLRNYVAYLDGLYSDTGKSWDDLKDRNEYINSWLKLWQKIAYDSLNQGTFEAIDLHKVDIAKHYIAYQFGNEKERKSKEELLDTINDIRGILDIDIYIPLLSELFDLIEDLFKDALKGMAYPYIVDMAVLISGKPRSEINDFDSAIKAVKDRFVNVEVLLRNPLIFEENKNCDFPSKLSDEWKNMGATYDLNQIGFPAFKNACKMGYLCLMGPTELNRLLSNYDKSVKNYYNEYETTIGISSLVLSISTAKNRYSGTNKNLIVSVCGAASGGKETILDKFSISGQKHLQKNSNVRLTLPTSYTIPLSKIDHFLLRLDGRNLWTADNVSFFDGSTNIELTDWSGRIGYGETIELPVRRDVKYHYETVSYSAKISTLGIEIKTSNKKWSGTDDDVWFTVKANGGTYTQTNKLDKYSYNDFEAGDLDTYKISLNTPKTCKEIDEFCLSKSGSDAWRVDSVVVYDMETDECLSVCQINGNVGKIGVSIPKGNNVLHLVDDDDDVKEETAPIQDMKDEQMIRGVMVTIKTANKWLSGTDDDVYFTSFYLDNSNNECTERKSLDTSWHNDFEKGDTDTFKVMYSKPIPRNKMIRFELNKKGSDDWTIDWVKVQDFDTFDCLGKYEGRIELASSNKKVSMPIRL